MNEFKRENRYIILKNTDLGVLTSAERTELEMLCDQAAAYRHMAGKQPLDCVVVEHDWPEYETVWGMIEARMTGRETELAKVKRQRYALLAALKLAIDSHGKMLLTDPPQDAWKARQVDAVANAVIADVEAASKIEEHEARIAELGRLLTEANRQLEEARKEAERNEALCDTNYAAGVQAGWNCGVMNDTENRDRLVSSRRRDALSVLAAMTKETGHD